MLSSILDTRPVRVKQRQKTDYVTVVLGSFMSLCPNDVISVRWAGDMFSLATVAGDPLPSRPLDLHVKLCLRDASKQQMSLAIHADPDSVQRVHQRKLDHTLRRVLEDSNLRKLHAHDGHGTIEEFKKRLWNDMRLVITNKFPECIGQVVSVERALGR